ncbi:MAG: fructosamine kinase family protein [Acidimicrobiales bacterium]|nr:fructosamine kinase family protein [Acidimicrobiales bacterium]
MSPLRGRHPLLDPEVATAVRRMVSSHLGRRWHAQAFDDLDDLASHPCGVLRGQGFSVFAKLNTDPTGPAMFDAELQGLALLARLAGVATPAVIGSGVARVSCGVVFVVEAFEGRRGHDRLPEDWSSIGTTLAAVHTVHGERFGLEAFDGFYGPLPQDNRPTNGGTWAEFYAERRLRPRLRAAVDARHLPATLASRVEGVLRRLDRLSGPEPVPTLLHGDAQQNNFVSTDTGAVIVDGAPYFGHPEMDLALVDYFEPAPKAVFDSYRERLSIDGGFAERRDLWRLHAYLAGIAVAGDSAFGRSFLARLETALDTFR